MGDDACPGAADCISAGSRDAELRVGESRRQPEKGKFADVIAVSGNPLQDVSEVERVKFVMKGGMVVRDELSPPPVSSVTR